MDWTYCKNKMPQYFINVLLCVDEPEGPYVYAGFYQNQTWYFVDGTEFVPSGSIYAWAYFPDPAPLPEEAECTT